MAATWLYPLILIAGALQAWGPPMNGALRGALSNPWLASFVSFLPIVALLICLFVCLPRAVADGGGGERDAVVGAAGRVGGRVRRHCRADVRRSGGRRDLRRADHHGQYSDVVGHRTISGCSTCRRTR